MLETGQIQHFNYSKVKACFFPLFLDETILILSTLLLTESTHSHTLPKIILAPVLDKHHIFKTIFHALSRISPSCLDIMNIILFLFFLIFYCLCPQSQMGIFFSNCIDGFAFKSVMFGSREEIINYSHWLDLHSCNTMKHSLPNQTLVVALYYYMAKAAVSTQLYCHLLICSSSSINVVCILSTYNVCYHPSLQAHFNVHIKPFDRLKEVRKKVFALG